MVPVQSIGVGVRVSVPVGASDTARLEQFRGRSFYQGTLDALSGHVAVVGGDGAIIAVNGAWMRFARQNGGAHIGTGDNYLSVCDAAAATLPEAAATAVAMREILAGERGSFECVYPCHAPIEERWFSLRATFHRSEGPIQVVVEHVDITEQVLAERASRLRDRLLDSLKTAVIATDLKGLVTEWSDGAEELFGWVKADALDRFILDLTVPDDARAETSGLLETVARDGHWYGGEVEMCRQDGSRFIGSTHASRLMDDRGRPSGFVSVSSDVTERVHVQREVARTRNQLTAVTESMGEALVGVNQEGEVIYMNSAAEQLLGWPRNEFIGRKFREETCRLDADSSGCPSSECPGQLARREDRVVRVDEELLSRRDGTTLWASYTVAPFDSEETRRGSVIVIQDITEERAEKARLKAEVESLSMIGEVRDALDEDRMELFAQPIVELSSGDVVQHELLIRMRGKDGALVPPIEFLPIAERYGYMRRIDCWVVDQAADLLATGRSVEINLSASSLSDPELMGHFEAAFARREVDPSRLVIEITETALVEDEATATAFMHEIAGLGCKVALDDFGTGYGGFTYLKHLPVHYLKVDREFIRDIATNEASLHLTEAVVGLAHSFDQKVIAEGVEDDATAKVLSELGVELAQGFGLGRPAPLDEIFPE